MGGRSRYRPAGAPSIAAVPLDAYLTGWVLDRLAGLKHANGAPKVRLCGPRDNRARAAPGGAALSAATCRP
jgi:hypothetical protein